MSKIKKLLIILIFLLGIFLIGCQKEEQLQDPVEYKITYNLNGGAFDSEVSLTYTDGNNYVLPKPTKKGYEFSGWKEVLDDGSISSYEVTFLNNRDYNLIATWEKVYQSDELTDLFTLSKRTKKDVIFKTYLNQELKMDIYLPAMKQGEKYPVLFFFFGGGWYMGDKSYISYYSNVLRDLNGEGFIVVAPNYRLVNSAGNPHYPLPVEDCFDAIRYVVKYQEELHADIDNMGAFGHSAGAYFSLMTAFAQDHYQGDESLKDYKFKLKYAVALAAPSTYDLNSLSLLSVMGKSMLSGYLGTTDVNNGEFESAFPSYYIKENNPIIYLVHGDADPLVPVEQSRMFYELATKEGIDCRYIEIPHADHTFNGTDGYDVSGDYATGARILREFILSMKRGNNND